MLIVFIGPPGSGKGTQARKLTEYLGIPHLSTGEMLRNAKGQDSPLGRLAAEYMDTGRLAPDPLVVSLVGERLDEPDCDKGCLFDGFPRTINQAKSLDDYLEQRGTKLRIVLELVVEEEELTRRMLKRSEIEHRIDDTPETIAERFKVYRKQTSPVLGYYKEMNILKSIEGMNSPEEVFESIKSAIANS